MSRRIAFAHHINKRAFYGWVMLGIAFIGLLGTGPGQSYTIGLFFGPLIDELGISSTVISVAYGGGTALAALGLTYTGRLVDRYGPRRMLAAISVLLGLSCMLFSLIGSVATLFLAFTVLRFLGQGSLTLASTNLVSQWFSKRRGFALSVAALGFALGLAAYPPAVQWAIVTLGWRQAWLWQGAWVWLLMLAPVLLLVVDKPDLMGLRPDGARLQETAETAAQSAAEDAESWTAAEALRTVTFWLVGVALAIPAALITGMYIYHVQYFTQQGFTAQAAANLFSVTSVAMVVAMLVFGQLLDAMPTRFVVGGGVILNGLALIAMYFAQSTPVALLYALLLGACSGATMTNANYVWPQYFGRRHLGGIQGAAYTITIIGASLGAIPFGLAYDLLGSYRAAVGALAALPLVFGVAVAFVPPPVRKSRPRPA